MYLETERLYIRELTIEDLDALMAIFGDPEVMEYSLNGPMNREEAEEYLRERILANYAAYGHSFWGVVEKHSRELVGIAGLLNQVLDEAEEVELGYRLARDYWGRGFASEATRAIRDYAFDVLGLEHIISIIEPSNIHSVRVAEQMGMTVRTATTFHGFNVDIYHVTRD